MRDESLLIENHASVRRIWLNRADAANAQTRGMLVALDEAIAAAADDDTVRVIILAGKGKHFSAGHDLKEAQEKRSDFTAQERWRYEEFHYLDYCLNIWDCPKPVVAQVQGPAWPGVHARQHGRSHCRGGRCLVLGFGAVLDGFGGHRSAFPALGDGIAPRQGISFTGERITAEQAYRVGMVNRVVAREALDDATLAIAERIAQAPPFAMRALKNRSTAPMTSKGSAMRCKRISILIRSLTRRRSSLKSGISACRRSSRTTRPIRGAQCISLSTP